MTAAQSSNQNRDQKKLDLVLEGGGAKGLAHPGAVTRLYEEGYAFERVAGTSAGAITAAVVAAVEKYFRGRNVPGKQKIDILKSTMGRLDPSKVPDSPTPPHIPLVSELYSLLTSNGVYEGDYIRDWLHKALKDLGVETFGDLRRDDRAGDDEKLPPYSLVVTATDVTHGRLLRLPWDYHDKFNLVPDEQLVADAVRMSLSIPFYFKPRTLTRKATGGESVIVDGGVLSNFPIDMFDRTDNQPRRWPTVGVRLLPDLPAGLGQVLPVRLPQRGPVRLAAEVVATGILGHDQTHLNRPGVRDWTISIDTSPVQFTEFDLTQEKWDALLSNGSKAAEGFLMDLEQRPFNQRDWRGPRKP